MRFNRARAGGRARLARRRHGARARRAICARRAFPTPRTISPRRWRATASIVGADRRACSTPASTRGSRMRTRAGSAKRPSAPRSRNGLRDVTSLDDDRILRRFVNLVEAAIRTNFFQLEDERAAAPDHRVQVRMRQGRRSAAAPAALRDLRLFAARRGRAPALRQGRARRACAGPTGRRISAPRCSASSRRSR